MKSLLTAFATIALILPTIGGFSLCSDAQKEVFIKIEPDDFPQETSWELTDAAGNVLAQGGANSDTVCVDSSACLTFTIYDEYGDGICCDYGQGSYTIYLDGSETGSGGAFQYEESISFNCPPGYSCNEPVEIAEGSYTAAHNDFWYLFTPATTGIYSMTTCSLTTCDTRIWLYEDCENIHVSQDNTGTIYYDDNEGGCGEQAQIVAYLEAAKPYFIRIGSTNNSCASPIDWELIFGGEISGCTDPNSCNYNPLASQDDGSCLPAGDPDCGGGPDLWVLEDRLRSSLQASVISNNTDNCLISEGCVQGFGRREVVRFTTHIKNIGDMDYYIGRPSQNPDQFSFDNCHGHYHYEGYAEYRMYNADNEPQPIGFKNGFCVIDLECEDGGTQQYGCSNMGISAGCGDYYSSGLQCQWVDVTGLPDGDYTLVVTVNWDRSADALGNYELSYDNNWAQVCFHLERDKEGNHSVTLLEECPVVTDCEGTPFGNIAEDCAGICGGTNVYGDLNADQQQTTADASDYIYDIIAGGLEATPCFDLDADGAITVFDAALVNDCYLYGSQHQHPGGGNVHDHCHLPGGVTNPTHEAQLTILDYDPVQSTIDIGIRNVQDQINAYEFNMSGIGIVSVINLVDPDVYPVDPDYSVGGNKVIGISLTDSMIPKSQDVYQPLCRIQFEPTEDAGEVCIDEIIALVNSEKHRIGSGIMEGCAELPTGLLPSLVQHNFRIYPNPGTGRFQLDYKLPSASSAEISVINDLGQISRIFQLPMRQEGHTAVDLTDLPPGFYTLRFHTEEGVSSRKIVVAR